MKRVLLISAITALCVAACGEKSNLTLKARQQQAGAGNPAPAPEKAEEKVEGAFVSLENADISKLAANTKTTRNVLLGDDSSKITVLCADNLEAAVKKTEHIKILGGSQIMIPQDTELAIPETAQPLGRKEVAPAKDIVNILCNASAAPTVNLENATNITALVLTPGSPKEVIGKFSTSTEDLQTINIACGNDEDLAKADQFLFPGSGEFPVKLMISVTTKMLFETAGSTKQKEYILVSCQAPPAENTTPPLDPTSKTKDTPAANDESEEPLN